MKEGAGESPADKIFGSIMPGSPLAIAVDTLLKLTGKPDFAPLFRIEMKKLGVEAHTEEIIIRAKELLQDRENRINLDNETEWEHAYTTLQDNVAG